MKVVIIDNYDSFTYNLHHYVEPLVDQVDVLRNDAFDMEAIADYDGIILSPGPGLPQDAGQLMPLIAQFAGRLPILGVCLGHQALGLHYGAQLENMDEVLHGRPSMCRAVEEDPLFHGISSPFQIGHYHSWVVSRNGFPSEHLCITAEQSDGHIMAMRHHELAIHSVQFHPESILTPDGKQMIRNWIQQVVVPLHPRI